MACLVVAAAILVASGVALAATLNGTSDADTIDGTDSADTIDGKAGADTIRGKGGGDTIYGGDGRDKIYAVDESENPADDGGGNYISGNEKNDTIVGGPGADELHGARDDDTINGMGGADTIDGGVGADVIRTGPLEEKDVDTVRGDEGNDTIYVANYPASKDVVGCGRGDKDKVVADSLDEVASSCEKVERIQEEEPQLADGTYGLVPAPSSECSLGEGTFTIGNDPETGERSVEVNIGDQPGAEGAPDSTVKACKIQVDYQNPVPAPQGGEVSAQGLGSTYSYKGEKPPQTEVDQLVQEAQNSLTEEDAASSDPTSGEVSAQYAWYKSGYLGILTTYDPAALRLNSTYNSLRWWYNGYSVSYLSKSKFCPSGYNGYTTWYTRYCYFPYFPWYGSDSYDSWIGNRVNGGFYNDDFFADSQRTNVYTRVWVYGYDGGSGEAYWGWIGRGEFWWLLTPYTVEKYI